jgi:cephalosporin-C deacetylase-like acetyl esterase
MPQRKDISFRTVDHVILRGWLYTPDSHDDELPCLVMSHGFSAVKEMDLDTFAEYFTSHLQIACLAYDNRGFGASDVKEGEPRQEIVPSAQQSDICDAITYAQTLKEVDAEKIGVSGPVTTHFEWTKCLPTLTAPRTDLGQQLLRRPCPVCRRCRSTGESRT